MNIYCMTVCEIGWHAAWHPSVCIHVYGRCTVFLSSFCVFMYVWVCAARACFAWYVFISLYVFIIVFVLLQNAHRFLQSLCEVCICCGLNIANKRIKKNSSQRERGKKIRNIEMQKKNMKTTMWTRRLNATRIINKILSDSAKYRPAKWQIKEHPFAQPGKLV